MEMKECTCEYVENPICPFGLKTRIGSIDCPTHSETAAHSAEKGKPLADSQKWTDQLKAA
jgi:hypothetical protein